MTTWINKIAQRLIAFLATEDNKYIVTETGLRILVINNKGLFKTRSSTSYINKNRLLTSFNKKIASDTSFSRKTRSITNWNNKLES